MPHILLLEPNVVLGKQYASYLQNLGYTVAVCSNAQAAISAADARKPDLIIMEILLAGHSGVEFIHEFRSYAEWRAIPLVVLSRLPLQQLGVDDKTLDSLGISAYLYKPDISLEKLAKHIERYTPTTAKKA